MGLLEQLLKKKEKLAVVGLGYVGLPLAVAFSKQLDVIGYDSDKHKVELCNKGIDPTREAGDVAVRNAPMVFSSDESILKKAKFIIVTVPTPINADHTPDLIPIEEASRAVGRNLQKGAVVVYESTVYPGVTEDICVPLLERESGMKCGDDFKIGYSPERTNPGDKIHRLDTIVKIVSGMDEETLDIIAHVYELVASAGVHRVSCIKVAEAAKVIENSQRDINIAFMNELSIIFHKMEIDTREVLEAAGTKWNFLNFQPGLVGGHCVGVDPYYLTTKAAQLGYHSRVILSGRSINDNMGRYVAENIVKGLIKNGKMVKDAQVAVLGFAFKENCQDIRNTKVMDIVKELWEYGVKVLIVDDVADIREAKRLYEVDVVSLRDMKKSDAIAVCVQHQIFRNLSVDWFNRYYKDEHKILFDIKGMYKKEQFLTAGYFYWRL